MKFILAALIALVSVAALQEVTVPQGETIGIQTSIVYPGTLAYTTAVYTVDGTNFIYSVTNMDKPKTTIVTPIRFDLEPGTYTLNIAISASDMYGSMLVRQDQVKLTITPKGTPSAQPTSQQTAPSKSVTVAPRESQAKISIPAIPDVNAGETLVVPVTIRGNGVYSLTIPTLNYATYEMPTSVSVNGERTVPIVLHIDKNAGPGLYVLPVSASGESASARIRVLRYEHENNWGLLIIAGIILIVIGLVLVIVQSRRPKTPKEKNGKPKEDVDLITYY